MKKNGFTSSTRVLAVCAMNNGYSALIYDMSGVYIALSSALSNEAIGQANHEANKKRNAYLAARKSQQKCFDSLKEKVISGHGENIIVSHINVLTHGGAFKVYGTARIIGSNPLIVVLLNSDIDGQTIFEAELAEGDLSPELVPFPR
ncbi:MAG: hypothetical protein IE909_19075 [Campylobacterales bacterium]|nr:hypothetical protein [Campylobacterales bacterium]